MLSLGVDFVNYPFDPSFPSRSGLKGKEWRKRPPGNFLCKPSNESQVVTTKQFLMKGKIEAGNGNQGPGPPATFSSNLQKELNLPALDIWATLMEVVSRPEFIKFPRQCVAVMQ